MQHATEHIKDLLQRIPEEPGVYQYFDEKGKVIYVGKAKNLKRRVHSYFNKNHDDSPKTRILVSKIRDLRYTVVESEMDALLLENNLIKQYKPRYNILLKDDKTYPSLCLKKENFPRLLMTRKIIKDGSEYFGPYSSMPVVRELLDTVKKMYPLRTCQLNLNEEDIAKGKYKECLYYHLKKCKAPCIGRQSRAEYDESITHVRQLLKGHLQEVETALKKEMLALAENLEYEKANELKEKLGLLEKFNSRSYIVNSRVGKLDVYAYDENDQSAFISYLNIAEGCVVQTYTFEYRKQLEETKENILSIGIFEMRKRFGSRNRKALVPFLPEWKESDLEYIIPQRGDAKQLLDLAMKNVRQYKLDLIKQQEKLNPEQRSMRLVKKIQEDLHLSVPPIHMECFDNSNLQGTNPVASCVVFKMAKPSKKDYRHFKIKTVEGPNDFASMEEILTRRYTRLLIENQELPQVVIVDGGKGQLHSAVSAMSQLVEGEAFSSFSKEEKDEFRRKKDNIQLIGIAKRLEEIFYPGDPIPLYLDKNSETLKVIQHLRDEAHRFGITFHRQLRSKAQVGSELDRIRGIGEKTRQQLLKEFKSINRVKKATREELEKSIGQSKAALVYQYFAEKENNDKKEEK